MVITYWYDGSSIVLFPLNLNATRKPVALECTSQERIHGSAREKDLDGKIGGGRFAPYFPFLPAAFLGGPLACTPRPLGLAGS